MSSSHPIVLDVVDLMMKNDAVWQSRYAAQMTEGGDGEGGVGNSQKKSIHVGLKMHKMRSKYSGKRFNGNPNSCPSTFLAHRLEEQDADEALAQEQPHALWPKHCGQQTAQGRRGRPVPIGACQERAAKTYTHGW